MKNKLFSLGAVAILLAVTNCSHVIPAPVYNNIHKLIEISKPGKLPKHYQGDSDYIVALIPNMHNSFECQANTYLTLDSFKDDIRFLARENVEVGISVHTRFDGPYYPKSGDKGVREPIGLIEDFMKLPLEERVATVDRWIEEGAFPEGTYVGIPVDASFIFEAVYQNDVDSFGVDDRQNYLKSVEVFEKFEKGTATQADVDSTLFKERERKFVENIEFVHGNIGKTDGVIVPFFVGAYHIPGLRRLLEEKGISYILIENDGCEPSQLTE